MKNLELALIRKRTEKNLTQTQVAKMLGIGQSSYHYYESGIVKAPRGNTMQKLEQFINS